MPEVTFGNSEGAAPASVVEAPVLTQTQPAQVVDSVPVTQTVTVPAIYTPPGVPAAPSGLVLGDKLPTFNEIIFPRLNLVQNSGLLKDQFPPGSIVHGQSLVIYETTVFNKQTNAIIKQGTPPVILTVLGFRPTRFVEKIQGGERGLICNTEAEVRSAGGTLDYNEWKLKAKDGMKRFEYLADAVVLIERPAHCADDDTVFIYPVNGKKYALAMWSMKGTAYTHAAKRVFFTNRQMGCLRKGYPSRSFAVSTKSEQREGNTYFVPVCIPHQESTAEMIELISGILSGAN